MRPGFISLIFFIFEFCLLCVIILKKRSHPHFRLICLIMFCLQVYQLTEFLICIGLVENVVGRLALVSITWLPPLGYILTSQIIQRRFPDFWLAIIMGAVFTGYYLIAPDPIDLVNCNPFYAVYAYNLMLPYGIFYFGWIFYALGWLIYTLIRKHLYGRKKYGVLLLMGYLSFLLPMAITLILSNSLISAVTSIMCKYAVLLAIILFVFSCIPYYDLNEEKT